MIFTPQLTRPMGRWGENREKRDMSWWTSLMETLLLLQLNWRRCMRFPRSLPLPPVSPSPPSLSLILMLTQRRKTLLSMMSFLEICDSTFVRHGVTFDCNSFFCSSVHNSMIDAQGARVQKIACRAPPKRKQAFGINY